MTTLFDKTRGIRARVKHHMCQHGKWTVENWEYVPGACYECEAPQGDKAFYTPNTTPFYNHGLGCVTHGTRHAEKIAKTRGLTPIGDTDFKTVAKQVWSNHPLTRSITK